MVDSGMIITENFSLVEAMEKLDYAPEKVLFVVRDEKLVAALSDGDIRRWVIANGNIDVTVAQIANYSPKYLLDDEIKSASDYILKNDLKAIPIVDNKMQILKIITRKDLSQPEVVKNFNIPVVMMAGGFGTRLYPYTKILPKPLIPVGEIPIAEHIINSFNKYGCDKFFLVVNHKKNMIKAYFNEIEKDYSVEYADEDIPLGTGGGLSLLKGKIKDTFAFTNCDILITDDLYSIYEHHKKEHNKVTMVCSLKNFKIPYGVIDIGVDGEIKSMKEKPSISFFTNTGCYIVEPEVIDSIEDNKFIGFPDVVQKLKAKGEKVGAYPISENSWLDMGQLDELEKMKTRLNLE